LGLETVPVYNEAFLAGTEGLDEFLERESCLGGTTIEGVVLKNYDRFGRDKHCLMGKYVSVKFQELHQKTWNRSAKKDLVLGLAEELRTEARWEKAVQSLQEQGQLVGEAKDIGPLLKELNKNVLEEESDYIKERIFKWVWKKLSHQLIRGFPEWYKKRIGEDMKATIRFDNDEIVELDGEKADKLHTEFAIKKFRRGDKFTSGEYTFVLTWLPVDDTRYWFLVNVDGGAMKNYFPREIETHWDDDGDYITKLPTTVPEDFGLERKYGF